MIYRYIPKAKRKAASLGLLAKKQAKRDRLGVDDDTIRWRAMRDAADKACILENSVLSEAANLETWTR